MMPPWDVFIIPLVKVCMRMQGLLLVVVLLLLPPLVIVILKRWQILNIEEERETSGEVNAAASAEEGRSNWMETGLLNSAPSFISKSTWVSLLIVASIVGYLC